MTMGILDNAQYTDKQLYSPWTGIIYSEPGLGKSWFARHSSNPFVISIEKGAEGVPGTGKLRDKTTKKIIIPGNQKDLYDIIGYAIKNKNEHKTVIFDSAKFITPLIESQVIIDHPVTTIKKKDVKVTSITDYPFGKGYEKVLRQWQRIITSIRIMNDGGMNVLIICHSTTQTAEDESGNEYKRITLDLPKFGRVIDVGALLWAACDWCYFMRNEGMTKSVRNSFGTEKTIPVDGAKKRTRMYTRSTALFDAKVRAINASRIPDRYDLDLYNDDQCRRVFEDLEK